MKLDRFETKASLLMGVLFLLSVTAWWLIRSRGLWNSADQGRAFTLPVPEGVTAGQRLSSAILHADKRVDVPVAIVPWQREEASYTRSFLELAQLHGSGEPPPLEEERQTEERDGRDDGGRIELSGDFECGFLPAVEKISDTHFSLDFTGQPTQMFLFKVKGASGKTVRIDLKHVVLENWYSLNPVLSYVSDLNDLDAYSDEPVKETAKPTPAYNGPWIPDTHRQKWDFISNVWMEGDTTLCLVQHFVNDEAYVAMKYPYTVRYNEAYLEKIAKNPHAKIIQVGESARGRPLQIVEIVEGSPQDCKTKPCIVMYAREHASEHDSSWAVQGAIDALLKESPPAAALRAKCVFILIPVLDPDAVATETLENIINTFYPERTSRESKGYGQFFKEWIDQGFRLDVVINLHNIESAGMPHVFSPVTDPRPLYWQGQMDILGRICVSLSAQNLLSRADLGGYGPAPLRLGGWLNQTYGALHTPYELNSQECHEHLSIDRLRTIGATLLTETVVFLTSEAGSPLLADTDRLRKARLHNWETYGRHVKGESVFRDEQTVRDKARSELLMDAIRKGDVTP